MKQLANHNKYFEIKIRDQCIEVTYPVWVK